MNFIETFFLIIILTSCKLKIIIVKKCGLTIASTCSKCDKVVDVEILDDGCIVQKTKCGDCANTPVVKDICAQQK